MASTRAIAALAAGIVAFGLLSGCGSGGSSGAGDPSENVAVQPDSGETPVRGGTLTYAADREPFGCLDPHAENDIVSAMVGRQFLDSVTVQDRDGTIKPWLAESWTVSDDGLTWRFVLREGVTFHDGERWDAAAFKANLEHMVDPDTGSSTAGNYLRPYRSSRVIDDRTLEVTLRRPYSAFLEVLAQSFLGMQSPKALARSKDDNCRAPVGSGPFRVESYTPQDRVVLVRNDDYDWAPSTARHQGPAYLDRIVWRWIPEPSVRWGALRNGEVDVIDGVPPTNLAEARNAGDLQLLALDRPGNPFHIDLNTRRAVFSDVKVRQAFRHSVDIPSALRSIYFDSFRYAGAPLSPATTFYDPALEGAYPFDIARANALLDEAGWTERNAEGVRLKDGKPLKVSILVYSDLGPDWIALHEQIQATAKEAGFDVELNTLELSKGFEVYANGEYDAAGGYWITNTADVLRIKFATEYIESPGFRPNGSFHSDPEVDALLNEALATTDADARRDLYARVQKRISDKALQVTLYPQNLRLAVDTDRVRGVEIEPSLALTNFYDAWVTG